MSYLIENALGKMVTDCGAKESKRIGYVMRSLGWKKQAIREGDLVLNGFKKGKTTLAK